MTARVRNEQRAEARDVRFPVDAPRQRQVRRHEEDVRLGWVLRASARREEGAVRPELDFFLGELVAPLRLRAGLCEKICSHAVEGAALVDVELVPTGGPETPRGEDRFAAEF